MAQDIVNNPYQAPTVSVITPVTARGYSPAQCLGWFFLIGIIGGAIGGLGTSALNAIVASTPVQVLPVGVAFAISLWVSTGVLIERGTVSRNLLLLIGCIAGFAVTAVVYTQTLPPHWYARQSWTWVLIKPYIFGAGAGAFVITASLRCIGGKVPNQVLLSVWLFIAVAAFSALFTIDELGTRTGLVHEPTVAFICGGAFIAIVLPMIGWQLAIANSAVSGQARDPRS